MRRLRILFITAWYPTEKVPVSGIFVREHAKAVSLYNDVIVLYNEGYDKSVKGIYEYREEIQEGIPTVRIRYRRWPIPRASYINYLVTIILGVRRIIRNGFKPDIIHAHVYSAGVPAVIIGKLFRIPVVITEHYSGFPRRILSKKEIKKARYAMIRAKCILPVSDSLRKSIESYGIKNRFYVIPNAVDTNLFYPDGQSKKDTNIKRILLVASLRPVKGVFYLLQALHILNKKRNDFFLEIIGDGHSREEYEKLAAELGISDKIRFHGTKSKQEIAEFMRNVGFFVLPSLWETFGCVLIEAMASGLPIIATNVGGVPEIVSDEVGRLVSPKASEELASAIDYMLEHYKDYSIKKISQYAKERFSYEAVGKKLTKIYQELVRK